MLTLVFENCEVAEIEPENLVCFNIWGITKSISFFAAFGRIDTLEVCKGFKVAIKNPNAKLVERCLKCNDITQVRWQDTTYFVDWGDQENDNENQSSYVAEDGMLHISVEEFDGSLFQC